MNCKRNTLRIFFLLPTILLFFVQSASAEGALPKKGDAVPALAMHSPVEKSDIAYLGLGSGETFSIADIDAELVFLEIVGVYCTICHKHAPDMRRFFSKLQKNPKLNGKVKALALAVGATPMEVAFLKEKFKAKYPIVTDGDFSAHKLLGEPDTPFSMLMKKNGTVLYTHLGPVKDYDAIMRLMEDSL